jgi:Tol biopolymer transport system component
MKTFSTLSRVAPFLTLAAWAVFPVAADPLQLISTRDPVAPPADGGNGDSSLALLSPDGRHALFASTANNLVSLDGAAPLPFLIPQRLNVFLRDRSSNSTRLVSVNLAGTAGGNGDSFPAGLSSDGRRAMFESRASDLVENDTNNAPDVFARDLVSGKTLLVSAATNGLPANGASRGAVMTPDGRRVAFVSEATDLVADDTNGIPDVFVRDLDLGETFLASPGARLINSVIFTGGGSERPLITPDGRHVVFWSSATNLAASVDPIAPGARAYGEVYIRDLEAGTTIWASSGARAALRTAMRATDAVSFGHVISADGRFVAYLASRPGAANTNALVLRFDLQTGTTKLAATNAFIGTARPEEVHSLDMTPDGRFIAYIADGGAGSLATAVRVWDATTGGTTLASGDPKGQTPPGSICEWPALDAQGRFVVFLSSATNLVPNARHGAYHLYLRDLQAGEIQWLEAGADGARVELSPATVPRLSADGRWVAFEGRESPAAANDANGNVDVFGRGLAGGGMELLSRCDPRFRSYSPSGPSALSALALSADGNWLALTSEANDLVSDDTNRVRDVFRRDLLTGTCAAASVDPNGTLGNAVSFDPSISADGRYVAFASRADNLAPGDTNRAPDVFVRDLQAGATILASVSLDGLSPGNGGSSSPVLSRDGRYVLFRSTARNLAFRCPFSGESLFLRDLERRVTYSLNFSSTAAGLAAAATPDFRWIAFNDGPNGGSLYLWDTLTGGIALTNSRYSGVVAAGISPDGNRLLYRNNQRMHSLFAYDVAAKTNWVIASSGRVSPRSVPKFSADSRFLAYSWSRGVTGKFQVYLFDFQTGTNQLVSADCVSGAEPAEDSDSPDITPDGRFIAYRSAATSLVPNDANGLPDIFLCDRSTGTTTLVSTTGPGAAPADNRSLAPVFSTDGKTLFYQSWATHAALGDFNQSADIFALEIAASELPVFMARIVPGAAVQAPRLIWPLLPGKNYRAEYKDNLNDPGWRTLDSPWVINGNQGSLEDLPPASHQRFYRILAY